MLIIINIGIFIFACLPQSSISSVLVKQAGPLSPDKFGPVACHFTKIEICKGPKKTTCTESRVESEGNDFTNVTFTLDFKRNAQFTKTKISLWTNETLAAPDIVKWIDFPCSHFFLGPLLEQVFKPNPRCVVKKGVYVTRLNPSALVTDLLGISFFYGNYRSHTVMLGKDCNVICVRANFVFEQIGAKNPAH